MLIPGMWFRISTSLLRPQSQAQDIDSMMMAPMAKAEPSRSAARVSASERTASRTIAATYGRTTCSIR
jgi:hypothetical protein